MQGAQHYAQQNAGYLAARAQANAAVQQNNQHLGDVGRTIRAAGEGLTAGFGPDLNGAVAAGQTGLQNLAARFGVGKPAPYNMAQAYAGTADAVRADEQAYGQRHPVLNTAAQIGGAVLTPGAMGAAKWAAEAPNLAGVVARGAAVGAGYGGLSGAGHAPGGVGSKVAGAAQGAATGAIVGAAVPALGAAVSPVVDAAGTVAANAARTFGMSNPADVATQRLTRAIQKDLAATGQTPLELQQAHAAWPGNSTPTVADLAGENTRSLMRTAASSGPARQTMVDYRNQVAADLQPNAIYLTSQLTPGEDRSADQLTAALTQARATAAAKQYQDPYNIPVDSSPLVPALQGDAGNRALAAALRESDAMRLTPQVQDLQQLKTAANPPPQPTSMMLNGVDTPLASLPPHVQGALLDAHSATSGAFPPTVSLGALDRVKVALNSMGQDAQAAGRNGEASGYFGRAQELDDSLASQSPDYAAARDNYAGASRQIDAVGTGNSILKALGNRPEDYGAALLAMSPGETWAAQNGARSALTDAIGAPMESAQGTLNRISTGTNTGRNLAATFGPDQADSYQAGLAAELERMSNANYMSPNTGSQTQLRGQDSGGLGFLNPHHLAMDLIGKLTSGPGLSDEERSAIVNTGLGQNGVDDALLAAMMKSSQPSPLPGFAGYATPALAQQVSGGIAAQ